MRTSLTAKAPFSTRHWYGKQDGLCAYKKKGRKGGGKENANKQLRISHNTLQQHLLNTATLSLFFFFFFAQLDFSKKKKKKKKKKRFRNRE